MPTNAADMARFREAAAEQNETLPPSLPELTDGNIKQVLLPYRGSYVSATPVTSAKMLNRAWNALHGKPHYVHTVQPTPAAMANHGEAVMLQSGRVRMFRRGVCDIKYPHSVKFTDRIVCVRADVQNMNISGGMLSVGWPALTAIGGTVHALERKIGGPIQFAFGMKDPQWVEGAQKTIVNKSGAISGDGRMPGKTHVHPGFNLEQVSGHAKIVLLLKTDGASVARLANAAKELTRIAGGVILNLGVSATRTAPKYPYLIDASPEMARTMSKTGIDAMDAAVQLYAGDGDWREGGWYSSVNNYMPSMSGYGFLHEPAIVEKTRDSCYRHAFVEPVFSMVCQGSFTDDCWFSRYEHDWGVSWGKTK